MAAEVINLRLVLNIEATTLLGELQTIVNLVMNRRLKPF